MTSSTYFTATTRKSVHKISDATPVAPGAPVKATAV